MIILHQLDWSSFHLHKETSIRWNKNFTIPPKKKSAPSQKPAQATIRNIIIMPLSFVLWKTWKSEDAGQNRLLELVFLDQPSGTNDRARGAFSRIFATMKLIVEMKEEKIKATDWKWHKLKTRVEIKVRKSHHHQDHGQSQATFSFSDQFRELLAGKASLSFVFWRPMACTVLLLLLLIRMGLYLPFFFSSLYFCGFRSVRCGRRENRQLSCVCCCLRYTWTFTVFWRWTFLDPPIPYPSSSLLWGDCSPWIAGVGKERTFSYFLPDGGFIFSCLVSAPFTTGFVYSITWIDEFGNCVMHVSRSGLLMTRWDLGYFEF